jgi:hypothetical protein
MCCVIEFESNKNTMVSNLPEAGALVVTLQVLQDRNNRIRRKGGSRVSFCPPISENPITVHVLHLLWTFSLGKGICDIGVPEVHTQCGSKS